MSPFKDKVIQIIRMIPPGKVASYGQIAAYAGVPRGAREVGWILNGIESPEEVPWWRVLNMKGYLSIRGNQTADKELQKKLLEGEGIAVSEGFEVEMEKYRWRLDPEVIKQLQLDGEYLERLMARFQ